MAEETLVFFRFDDFSEVSPLLVEQGLVQALRRHSLMATFAVIPAVTEGRFHDPSERGVLPLSATKARFLMDAVAEGTVDAALHGWNHRSRGTDEHSEFVGLSFREQVARIQRARESLEQTAGISPSVFVPPWNRYDLATLKALKQLGFRSISANRYGDVDEGLIFAPITVDIGGMRSAIAAASRVPALHPIVGVLLHPYDFKESGDSRATLSCEEFEAELQWLRARPEVRVVAISELERETPALDAERFRKNAPILLEGLAPPWVRTTTELPVYLSAQGARRVRLVRGGKIISTYLLLTLIGLMISLLLAASPFSGLGGFVKAGSAILMAAVLLRAVAIKEAGFKPMALVCLMFGVLLHW